MSSSWTPDDYGQRWADRYDQVYPALDVDSSDMLQWLLKRFRGRSVVEFGIGTGRVGIPLREHGVDVEGVEASQAMADKLRAKPGGRDILVHVESMHTVVGSHDKDGAFCVFNSLWQLLDAASQLAALRAMRSFLTAGATLVVENSNPSLTLRAFALGNAAIAPIQVEAQSLTLLGGRHDASRQLLDLTQATLTTTGTELLPAAARYIWPSELDLMLQMSDFEVTGRYGDWDGSAFQAASPSYLVEAVAVVSTPP